MYRSILLVQAFLAALISSGQAQDFDGFSAPPLLLERFVPTNRETRIWFAWGITPDCRTLRGYSATVVRLPRNGTAKLARLPEVITPRWIWRGHVFPRQLQLARHCMGAEVLTLGLLYRPKAGFAGTDAIEVVTRSAGGMPGRRYVIRITVE